MGGDGFHVDQVLPAGLEPVEFSAPSPYHFTGGYFGITMRAGLDQMRTRSTAVRSVANAKFRGNRHRRFSWLRAGVGLIMVFSAAFAVAVSWSGPTAEAASTCGTSGTMSTSGTHFSCTYTVSSNSGLEDSFTVPAGVTSLDVVAVGAAGGAGGGDGGGGGSGGSGASVEDSAV